MNTAKAPRRIESDRIILGWKITAEDAPIGFHVRSASPSLPEQKELHECTCEEGHFLTIAPTGKGKGRSALIPNLLSYRGSVVAIDPKGELAAVTAHRRRKMGQEVVIIDPFGVRGSESGGLNPFDVMGLTKQSPAEFALEAADLLHHGMPAALQDPFWGIKADQLAGGVSALVATIEPEEQRHFLRVRDILLADDVVYGLAVLMDTHGKGMPKFASQHIAAFLQCEEKCRSGILATAQSHFGTLYGDGVEKSLRATTFDLGGFRNGAPITVYLIIPPSKLESHGRLLRTWVVSLLNLVMSRTRRPDLPTLFLLDEAAQLGEMQSVRTMMTLMRSWGARAWLFFQDLSQMKRLYSDWETILNNTSTIQIFGATTHLAARALAEVLGDGVNARDILSLPDDEEFLLEAPGRAIRAQKLDYLRDSLFRGLQSPNPLYETDALGAVMQ